MGSLYTALAAVLATLIGALAWGFQRGKRAARESAEHKRLTDYAATRRRMDDADYGADVASEREWLREHGRR